MFRRRTKTKDQRRIVELETQVDQLQRVIAVKDVEIRHLAALAARDRARVEAESAGYVRQRAESEGQHGRTS